MSQAGFSDPLLLADCHQVEQFLVQQFSFLLGDRFEDLCLDRFRGP